MKEKWTSFIKWLQKPWALVLACYVVVIVVSFGVMLSQFVADKMGIANGTLVEMNLTPNDFELIELEQIEGNLYQSTLDDPQMILLQVPQTVRTLRLESSYSSKPYEIDLYYTTKPGQDYSKTMRVWPVIQSDGSYLFTLPRTHIESLRLDPASAAVQIEFGNITLNEQQSVIHYFNPGWSGLVLLLIMPAFIAALLRFVLIVIQYYKKNKIFVNKSQTNQKS